MIKAFESNLPCVPSDPLLHRSIPFLFDDNCVINSIKLNSDPLLAPESRFQPGRDASNVPSTSEAMAEAYLQSDVRRRMIQEMEDYMAELAREKGIEEEFRAAVREDKNRGVISKNKSVYTVSFFSQVYALFIRNLQITVGHPFDLIFSYQSTVILALILGSTYINLPETALGAFSRGGLLFISV